MLHQLIWGPAPCPRHSPCGLTSEDFVFLGWWMAACNLTEDLWEATRIFLICEDVLSLRGSPLDLWTRLCSQTTYSLGLPTRRSAGKKTIEEEIPL